MKRPAKKSSRTRLTLSVASFSECWDYSELFDDLVRRYGGQSPSSSFTTQGDPKSFTFHCELAKSNVAKFKADWKLGTLDLNEKQKDRLLPAIADALKKLRGDMGEDDFRLLIRTLERKATGTWLHSCAISVES